MDTTLQFRSYLELMKLRIGFLIALSAMAGYAAVATKVDGWQLVILFIAAFATYQIGLLLGSAVVSAHGGMAIDIVAYVAFINGTWAIGLGAAYTGLRMLAGSTAVTALRRGA